MQKRMGDPKQEIKSENTREWSMASEYPTIELRLENKKIAVTALRNHFLTRLLNNQNEETCKTSTQVPGKAIKEKETATPAYAISRAGSLEAFSGMPLAVNWTITHMCNYKCSYCFGQAPLDHSKFTSLPYLKKAVDHIAELNRDTVRFTFSGGEPTTHPDLGQLIEHIHLTFAKRLQSVLVISNGSRNPKLYDRLAENEEIDRVCFVISLHPEFMELDHITSLIERLSHKTPLSLHLMFHPLKKDFVRTVHQELCQLRLVHPFDLSVVLLRRRPGFDRIDERYTPQDFEWHKEASNEFGRAAGAGPRMRGLPQRGYSGGLFWNYTDPACIYKKMDGMDRNTMLADGNFNFKGMYCIPGSSLLCIDPDGSAFGARCGYAPRVYNIFQENPYKHKDFILPVACAAANCGCATNDFLPKFASKEEAHDFAEMYAFKQAERMAL